MKHSLVLASLVLAVLAVAGCKPQTPAEPATPAPAADTAPTDPALIAAATPTRFDTKGFAGTFSGTLPCADCPGIDTRIELKPDGTYALQETYQGREDGPRSGDGNWTAEEDGQRLRLDPNSKTDEDRLFAIVGRNEIRLLDKEGKAVASEPGHSLTRAQ
ncbi:putative lipoprotein NlpE involved in copper resistance [Luteimonas cucumeris]|uniref:Putative lipoprotein NlpE involved in copper resistance n=1 Tax=Luteimonas cucumeris TaxID=985012 RepID=A0A562LAM7_9GAMM|nr:copper resistance protein NlpE [Luteimonas cucumeris]TWI04717.1 putative lipoprotein NlpE involved in copper resistance [Luteimonas cucumeris]